MKSRFSFHISGIALFLCLICLKIQAQNTSLPVGAIQGSADVTAMGAATYSIPIEVVPGTRGVQPNLSVVYNSMAGTGILGGQWDLDGISAITRVGQKPFLDLHSTSVLMTYSDRFALDGNRLICSDPTLYGRPGTLYQPEFEDFSKIYSYGSVGFGPEYFKVYRDDGSVAEYGNSADSKQRVANGIYSWYVNKITDLNGNYMTFTYGYSGSEVWIDHIDYTGNTSANLSPYARVSFAYDTYTHIGSQFVAGYEITQTRLLRTITVQYKNGNDYELVRQYQFDYTDEFPKRLNKVTLMGSDSTKLNPTSVEWNGTTNHDYIETSLLPLQYQESDKRHVAIDFNQDGTCDMFVFGARSWYYFENQNGQFIYNNQKYDANSSWYIQKCVPADMNGDGFSELISVFSDFQKHTVYVTSSQYPFQTDTIIPAIQTNGYKDVLTGDFLGNGQHQVVLSYRGDSSCYIRFPARNIEQPVASGNPVILDYDGDGKMELMVVDDLSETDYTIYRYNENLNTFDEVGHGTFSDRFRASGDFNGDGITDVIVGQYMSFQVMLGTGRGFVAKAATHSFDHNTLPYQIKPVVVDVNNDGFDDVVAFKKTTSGLTVICYVGCGFYKDTLRFQNNIPSSSSPIILTNSELGRFDFTFGDFNDDHHLDLISFKTISAVQHGVLVCEFRMDKRVPQVQKMTAGDGSFVKWKYQDIFGLHYRYASHISILPYQYNVVESMTNSLGTVTQTNTRRYMFEHPTYSFKRQQRMGFLTTSVMDMNQHTTDSIFYQVVFGENSLQQDFIMPVYKKTYVFDQLFMSTESRPICLTFNNNQRRYPYISKAIDTNHLNQSVTTFNDLRLPSGRPLATQQDVKNINDLYPQVSERITYQQTTHNLPSGGHLTCTDSIIKETWMNNSSIKSIQKQYFTYNNRYLPEQITVLMDGVHTSQTIQNYDQCGNGTFSMYSGDSCLTRTVTVSYDNTGRFPTHEESGPSFSMDRVFSPKTGLILSETDANNLTTSYSYDAFGKLAAIRYPDGNTDTIKYKWYTDNEIPYAKYYTVTHLPGITFDTERYYDLLGRNICTRERGFYTDTCYDIKGNVYRVSAPYMRGTSDANKIWHNFQYDQYGRITSMVGPYTNVSYQYAGYTETVTDNLRQTVSTRITDAVGRVCSVTDPGGTVTFNYSHVLYDGKTATQTNVTVCGHSTQILSDASGNRLRIVDPNAGEVTSRYNAHNQPIQQTDANGNNIRFQYDEWGRLTRKTNLTPSDSISEVFRYIYDNYTSSNHGQGKLSCVLKNDTLCEQYIYDTLSRLSQHTRHVDGIAYTESYAYNTYGQLATLTYPDGFAVDYTYTGKGYLEEIKRHDNHYNVFKAYTYNIYGQPTKCGYGNATATKYEYNAAGLLTRMFTGLKDYSMVPYPFEPMIPLSFPADLNEPTGLNGLPDLSEPIEQPFTVDSTIQNFRYTYDNMGRLTQRTQMNSQYEAFQYDNMDRLTSFTQGTVNGASQTFTTTYDGQGNILSNTLAGTYSYGSDKPHAVTEVTPNDTFPDAISASNCITEYNAFNQPSRIEEGDEEILLEYGADGQRVKAVFKYHGQLVRTRYYISANYEKEVEAGGVTTHYNYVYGVNGLAAICVRRTGVDSMYYVHPDRLGSYTHITNANKQVIRNLHFDPWGNVKSDTNWTVFADREPGELANAFRFDRGFTGHEHYADLKIINMNGRLYDPVIARFFSPDNFVQAPEFTQSYNRYSYCLNNPLQYTDPSGEEIFAPWYRDIFGLVQWADFGDQIPLSGTFLGFEGVFTSDGEMRYYYADGRISNLKLPQVFIDWGYPADFTFSFSSFPMRGAGFYRIGDPAEQMGSFSTTFQYMAPINPGYINGLNGLSVSVGTQYHLIEFAARSKYKSARTWRKFKNLSESKRTWRYNHSIGQSGKALKSVAKWTGNGLAAVSIGLEGYDLFTYTNNHGFSWEATTKFGIDFAMTCLGVFGGPVGFAISTTYFILDVSTDSFGGFGKMY